MATNPRTQRGKLLEAARGYLALGMPEHALRELDRIDDPDRCLFSLNQLRGEALRQRGMFEAALKAFGCALAEEPGDLSVLMGMAWCYKRTGRLPLAITAMEQAYRVSPEEPIVLYNLACYFSLVGDKTQSLSWLGRALRMDKSLRRLVPDEHDFDPLRDDPDFQFIMAAVNQPPRLGGRGRN